MVSGDPVPAISEAEATGEIADLYADIRATLGVPLVNLIWRNLASIPGALSWAWRSVKPLYENGAIQAEARALLEGQTLPRMPMLPVSALRASGVDDDDEKTVRAILDSYDRSNPLNLVALSALLAGLNGETAPPLPDPLPAPDTPDLDVALPRLLPLDEMATSTADLVRAINRLGARGQDHIIVSMPRHLAHWPGYLALYWTLIAPLDANGVLHECIDAVLADGRQRGARLAAGFSKTEPPPEASRAAIEATLDDFCRHAISRMIPVVSLLKRAMPVS
jgi:hypothetical protein